MRIPKSKVLYVSAAAAVLLSGSAVTAGAAYKTITVQDNGQRKEVRGFTLGNLGSFLANHNISVSVGDKVSPGLGASVKNGMVVTIARPVNVTVLDGATITKTETFASTVGEFMKQSGITLRSQDRVEAPMDAEITDGMTIRIRRTDQSVSAKTQDIPFQTIRQRTDQLYEGQQRVLTRGVKGSLKILTTSVYVNGHKVGQSVTKKVVQAPVTEVIAVGTQHRPRTLTARGVGSLVVLKQLTVVATAYHAGGRTATGHLAQPGVIAVDPRVIPLGTKLYIPGIGIVVAEDTGSAIRGSRIDICVGSESAAAAWGVRTITVYEIQ